MRRQRKSYQNGGPIVDPFYPFKVPVEKVVEQPTANYKIKQGETLNEISKRFNTDSTTLSQFNNIINPDVIKTNQVINLPKKSPKVLPFDQIPSSDNKKIVIDNFSKNFDYILEGDHVYYKSKSKNVPNWVDISDNETAKHNLEDHLDKNKYWAGYGSGEQESYKKRIAPAQPVSKSKDTVQDMFNPFDFISKTQTPTTKPTALLNDRLNRPVTTTRQFTVTDNRGRDSEEPTSSIIQDLFILGKNAFDRKISNKNLDQTINEAPVNTDPKSAKEYYTSNGNQINILAYNPGGAPLGRIFKQQSVNLDNYTWGYRSRNELKDINTAGLEITTFTPFSKTEYKDNESVIGVDDKGKVQLGTFGELKKDPSLNFTKTFKNNISSFDMEGDRIKLKASKDNVGFYQPIVNIIGDDGKPVKGNLNVVVKDANSENAYGGRQGGRVILVNPATKERRLVSGTLRHIKTEFDKMKGANPYLEVYTLDNGSYARGLAFSNNKVTKQQLHEYDLQNTSGGNGLYINETINKAPVSKYPVEFRDTPNIRSRQHASFKEGHPLVNEKKNIVLHHTGSTNPLTSAEETYRAFNDPNKPVSSHIVIQEDGKRTIYASPDQVTFHAGVSSWKGRKNVNDYALGIEFQGDTGKKPLTNAQIESFIEYYKDLKDNHNVNIPLEDIITHQMIAPGRKPDITNTEYQRIITKMKALHL